MEDLQETKMTKKFILPTTIAVKDYPEQELDVDSSILVVEAGESPEEAVAKKATPAKKPFEPVKDEDKKD